MKTTIIVAFACCFALALAEVGQKCNGIEDCDEGECCVKSSLFTPAQCKKLSVKDEICSEDLEWDKEGTTHWFICPCAEGLNCEPEEVEVKEGIVIVGDHKCVEPDSTVF